MTVEGSARLVDKNPYSERLLTGTLDASSQLDLRQRGSKLPVPVV